MVTREVTGINGAASVFVQLALKKGFQSTPFGELDLLSSTDDDNA
jgi:hypothetical protein